MSKSFANGFTESHRSKNNRRNRIARLRDAASRVFVGEALEPRFLLSAAPQLVKDIDKGPYGSNATNFVDVNGTTFFTADSVTGNELWKTDGTAAGTVIVKDIFPGGKYQFGFGVEPNSSSPDSLVNVNGTLFFSATDGVHGRELWKSNGTAAGTVMVTDNIPGSVGSYPNNLTNFNGTLFFSGQDVAHGAELWKSNGTANGTVLVKDIDTGNDSSGSVNNSYPDNLTVINNTLFFSARDDADGRELWKTSGSSAGTVLVKDIAPGIDPGTGLGYSSYPQQLTNVNGTLFFEANDQTDGLELWKSNGNSGGTVLVKDINPNPEEGSAPRYLTSVSGKLFFIANDGVHGEELWKSDGSGTGTVLVKDISSGVDSYGLPANSYIQSLTAVNGTLFFSANDGVTGTELWKSNGLESGTVEVKDIYPGSSPYAPLGSFPSGLTNFNGTLYFAAYDPTAGNELWKSNGTAAGTVLVKDINPGQYSSYPVGLAAVKGTLFFEATDAKHGNELYESDGTTKGTVFIKDINPRTHSSNPYPITDVDGTAFFVVNHSQIWKSDGSKSGTVLVKSFPNFNAFPEEMTDVDGTLFFSVNDPTTGRELWKSDGTAKGTVLVKDINTTPSTSPYGDPSSSNPSYLTNVNGTLFFVAYDGVNGNELWKSDGSSKGTVMVKDIGPGNNPYGAFALVNFNGTLFFSANDGVNGTELWKSNGKASGTTMVKDIAPGSGAYGPNSGSPGGFTVVGDTLFFVADDGVHGAELWKTNGKTAGTVMVKDIFTGTGTYGPNSALPAYLTNVDGTLFFVASDATHGRELWKSDGSDKGTVLVKDINPSTAAFTYPDVEPDRLTAVDGTLFFEADDGVHGRELWKSNGSERGTVMIKDLTPGPASSQIYFPVAINGTLYFEFNDQVHGNELWKSDGTARGTALVKDINPGSSPSYPSFLTDVNGTLFFAADDGVHGVELWKLDVCG